jgi:hypothetical protein
VLCGFGPVAVEAPDAQPRQAVFALAGNEEAGEEIHVFEHHVRRGWGIARSSARGPARHRRGDQAEVAPAIVGADEPQAVAMVDGVLVLVLAGLMSVNAPVGFVGGQHPASLVVWLADSSTMNLPSRVRPAPRLKRSSSS